MAVGWPSMAVGQQVPALAGVDGGDAWHCIPDGMWPHRPVT